MVTKHPLWRFTVRKSRKAILQTNSLREAAELAHEKDASILVRRSAADYGIELYPLRAYGEWRLVSVPPREED